MEYHLGKNPCPRCQEKGNDRSGDNFYWYGDGGGGHCWSCGYTIPSDAYKESMSGGNGKVTVNSVDVAKFNEKKLTDEQLQDIYSKTSDTLTTKYRGLNPDTCKALGVRWSYSEDGRVEEMWFPANIYADGGLKPTA